MRYHEFETTLAAVEESISLEQSTSRKEKTDMKNSLRGRIREFMQSEEGKVGVKSPLTLGVATGSILLAQTIVSTPQADAQWCGLGVPCPDNQVCDLHTCRDA